MRKMNEGAYHKLRSAPPTRPSACPVNQDFTPFNAHYLRDPYPQLERLNTQQPIFYAQKLGYLVVTRMQDLLEVFQQHEIYSSENVQDPVFALCERAAAILGDETFNPIAVMSNRQQPDHTRIRKYTREGFSSRRMKILEPYIRQRSHELIDTMLQTGSPVEFVNSFGHPLPGQTIFRLIGFPRCDDEQIMRWTANRLAFTWGQPSDDEQVEIAQNMLHYWHYCTQFVATRRTERADDLTSELLAAHDADPHDLTYNEIESIIYGLSFAGHEIVSNYLSNILLSLLGQRDNWQAICSEPQLIPNALEEVLRFDSPQTSWRRATRVDARIGGINIPAGTQIFLSLGAANHQENEFENPSLFDLRRHNARKHISFGYGIHFCLGARLARIEANIA
ncbi:MAG: cytochrome P450, partial [Gammaproteobacteria bacterium]